MTKHARTIERDGEEYTYSCTCRTVYTSRLSSWADAVAYDKAHKAAVAEGTWQAEQDAEAARMAAVAPLHDAKRAYYDAKDDRQSAAFAYIIAKQNDGDVEAARAELDRLTQVVEETAVALAIVALEQP